MTRASKVLESLPTTPLPEIGTAILTEDHGDLKLGSTVNYVELNGKISISGLNESKFIEVSDKLLKLKVLIDEDIRFS
jgi:hypothetical protein